MSSGYTGTYSSFRFICVFIILFILSTGCSGNGGVNTPDLTDHFQNSQSGTETNSSAQFDLFPIVSDSRTIERFVAGEVLIVFRDNTPGTEITRLIDAYPVRTQKIIPCGWGTLYEMEITDNSGVEDLADLLKNESSVRFAEPNYIFQLAESPYTPNDPKWECDDPGDDPRDNIFEQWGPSHIGANIVWNEGTGSEDVIIAVIDTGIRRDHQDIAANIWINDDEIAGNYIDDDSNGYIDDTWGWDAGSDDNDPWDDGWFGNYHGTACAGVAAAVQDNFVGLTGIAPGVKFMALKIAFDDTWVSKVIEATEYAVDNGADIISMSFGGTQDSEIYHAALDYAWDNGNGLNLLACAQNYEDSSPYYPAAYSSVMSIGATIPFNNYGAGMDEKKITKWQDGYEWGSNYGSWLTIMGYGDKYMTTSGTCPSCYYDGQSEDFFGGTSCATPMCAGVMALIHSFHPGQTGSWYWNRLQDTADDLDIPGFDIYTGYGRANAVRAVYGSDRFAAQEDGYGFVEITIPDQVFDTIHDYPGNPFHDTRDLYKFTANADEFIEINLDIFTWGEDLDLAVYSDKFMSELLYTAAGANHYGSSFETIGFDNDLDGTEYFLKVFSASEGNSSTYGLSLRTIGNWISVTGESISPPSAIQTLNPIPFLKLDCTTGYQATLDELIINKFGAAPSASLHEAYLYADSNGNETFDEADTLIAESEFTGTNRCRFTGINKFWDLDEIMTLFVAAVVNGAPDGSTVGLSLESYKDFETIESVDAPHTDFPISSDLVTLTVDNDPPYWLTTIGAQSADPGYGFAAVAFNEAVDDLTPPVKYNVIYTTVLPFGTGEVLELKDAPVSTGSTTDFQITVNCEGGQEWHFIVRAEDQAGNEDTNEVFVSCTPQIGGDPYNPQVINSYNSGGGDELAMHGDYIVLTTQYTALYVYRKIDPVTLEYVTSWDSDDYYKDIEYDGEFAYITGWDGLWVVDMADPENPVLAGLAPLDGDYVVLNGDWAYVNGGGGHTLYTVDISDPYNMPLPTSQTTPQAYHYEMLVNNNYLYMCNYAEGVMVFDISTPSNPIHISSFGDLGNPERLYLDHGTGIFYMVEIGGDIHSFDYSLSQTNPPLLDSNYDGDSYFAGGLVVVGGNYAYTTEANYGLYVYDVTDPSAIELISDLSLSGSGELIHDGPVIYAGRGGGIRVIM